MLITCKTANCNGHVEYDPQDPDVLVSFSIVAPALNVLDFIEHTDFHSAVKKIVEDPKNGYIFFKTVYLSCDNLSSGGPHINSYQVPSK